MLARQDDEILTKLEANPNPSAKSLSLANLNDSCSSLFVIRIRHSALES